MLTYLYDGYTFDDLHQQSRMLAWIAFLKDGCVIAEQWDDCDKIAPWPLFAHLLLHKVPPPKWDKIRRLCLHSYLSADEYIALAYQGFFDGITYIENENVSFTSFQLQQFIDLCSSLNYLRLVCPLQEVTSQHTLELTVSKLELMGGASKQIWPILGEQTKNRLKHLRLHVPEASGYLTSDILQSICSLIIVGGPGDTNVQLDGEFKYLQSLSLRGAHYIGQLPSNLHSLKLGAVTFNNPMINDLVVFQNVNKIDIASCGLMEGVQTDLCLQVERASIWLDEDDSQCLISALSKNKNLRHLGLLTKQEVDINELLQDKVSLESLIFRNVSSPQCGELPSMPGLKFLELDYCILPDELYTVLLDSETSKQLTHFSASVQRRRRIDMHVQMPECQYFKVDKHIYFHSGSSWGNNVIHFSASMGSVSKCILALHTANPISLELNISSEFKSEDVISDRLVVLDIGDLDVNDTTSIPPLPPSLSTLRCDWKWLDAVNPDHYEHIHSMHLTGELKDEDEFNSLKSILHGLKMKKNLHHITLVLNYIAEYEEEELNDILEVLEGQYPLLSAYCIQI